MTSAIKQMSIDDLMIEYKKIVKKHGDEALSSSWIQKGQYKKIHRRVQKMKISWHDFVVMCGFKPVYGKREISTDELIGNFRELIKLEGEKALSSAWVQKNNSCMYRQIYKKHRWNDFLDMCGHVNPNGQRKKMTIDDAVAKFQSAYKKHGNKCLKASWIRNCKSPDMIEYNWIYRKINSEEIKWTDFIQLALGDKVDFSWNETA